jgi:hypothetical protein
MAAHHSRLSPARSTDPSSRREPPEILVSALAALLSVVAAVCVLAVTHELWALLVAVAVMLAATLLLTFVIGLQLGQAEQPARARRRSRAVRPPADDTAAPDRPPAPSPAEPDGAAATASTTGAAASSGHGRDVADAMAVPTSHRSDPGTGSRLLFVADAAVADVDELPGAVRAVIDTAADLYALTPTLPGRLAWLADDVDRCRHVADDRLDPVLGVHDRSSESRSASSTGPTRCTRAAGRRQRARPRQDVRSPALLLLQSIRRRHGVLGVARTWNRVVIDDRRLIDADEPLEDLRP